MRAFLGVYARACVCISPSVHHHLPPPSTSLSSPGGRGERERGGKGEAGKADRDCQFNTPVRACPVVGEGARHDRMRRVCVQRCRAQVRTHTHTCTPTRKHTHTPAHTQARTRARKHTSAHTRQADLVRIENYHLSIHKTQVSCAVQLVRSLSQSASQSVFLFFIFVCLSARLPACLSVSHTHTQA